MRPFAYWVLAGMTAAVMLSQVPATRAEEPKPTHPPAAGDAAESAESMIPGARKEPPRPASVNAPLGRHSRALGPLRIAVGRALAIKNPEKRRARLGQAFQVVSHQLDATPTNPHLAVDLLSLRARIQVALGDLPSAGRTVERMHAEFRRYAGADEFNKWLPQEVDRLRNTRQFDLAILHLAEFSKQDSDLKRAARNSLLVGHILLQKGYPDGPYDAAIRQYGNVAERYRDLFPLLADDARLRQAKTLWRNKDLDSAREIFSELTRSANEAVAEEARHYPEVMEKPLGQ